MLRELRMDTLERELKKRVEGESERNKQAVTDNMERDLKVERTKGELKKERRKARGLGAKSERIRKDVEVVEDAVTTEDGEGKESTAEEEEGIYGYYHPPCIKESTGAYGSLSYFDF